MSAGLTSASAGLTSAVVRNAAVELAVGDPARGWRSGDAVEHPPAQHLAAGGGRRDGERRELQPAEHDTDDERRALDQLGRREELPLGRRGHSGDRADAPERSLRTDPRRSAVERLAGQDRAGHRSLALGNGRGCATPARKRRRRLFPPGRLPDGGAASRTSRTWLTLPGPG